MLVDDTGRFTHKVVTQPAISLAQDRESTPARTGVLITMLRNQRNVTAAGESARSGLCNSNQQAWIQDSVAQDQDSDAQDQDPDRQDQDSNAQKSKPRPNQT